MKSVSVVKTLDTQAQRSSEHQLDRVFHALADPTRRAILQRLHQSSGTVSALANPFDMSLNAVSKHLKVLERAKLITRGNTGRTSVCSLSVDPLQNAGEWIQQYTRFWNEVLDSLEQHLEGDEADNQASETKDTET